MDEQGRAVLKFIEGDVHLGWPEPMPSWVYADELTLIGAAHLLGRYHDLLATFTPPRDARWRIVAPGAHEVICHNDWAPYNAVFDGHRPIAMLDWDSAGPGSRVWDVGLSAYTWVPLYPKPVSNDLPLPLRLRASRLARFCAAYRGIEPFEVVASLVEQLPFLADFVQAQADAGDPGFAKLVSWNAPARAREHAKILRDQMQQLLGREG
jgi:Ser/Thr protein kinase RdoA (MazF antagonist)